MYNRDRERESDKMRTRMSVNDLIGSLPKIQKRKIWNVMMDGKVIQGVSATDNRESTARDYIASKYPNKEFSLVFVEYRIG